MKIGGDKCVKSGSQFDKSLFTEAWDGEDVAEEHHTYKELPALLGPHFTY